LIYTHLCVSLPPIQVGRDLWTAEDGSVEQQQQEQEQHMPRLVDPAVVGSVFAAEAAGVYFCKSVFDVYLVPGCGVLREFLERGHPRDGGVHGGRFWRKMRYLRVHVRCAEWAAAGGGGGACVGVGSDAQSALADGGEGGKRLEEEVRRLLCFKGQRQTWLEINLHTLFPEDRVSVEEQRFVGLLEMLREVVRELKMSGVGVTVWHHNVDGHRNDKGTLPGPSPACEIVSYFSTGPRA
jgi:hypothetical protein